jgi:hypothetical protein
MPVEAPLKPGSMFIWIEHVAARGAPTIPARHKNRAGIMRIALQWK